MLKRTEVIAVRETYRGSLLAIEDYTKNGGEELFTKMDCIL